MNTPEMTSQQQRHRGHRRRGRPAVAADGRHGDAQQRAGRRAEQRDPGERDPARRRWAGRSGRPARRPASSSTSVTTASTEDLDDLAGEVGALRHRRAGEPLEGAVGALARDVDRQVLQARPDDAGGDHPGHEVLGEARPRSRCRSAAPPRSPSSSPIGNSRVKTTDSRCRKNSASSTRIRVPTALGSRRSVGRRGRRGCAHRLCSPIIRRYTSSRVGRVTDRSGTSPGNRAASSRTNAVGVAVSRVCRAAVLGPGDDGGGVAAAAQLGRRGDLDQPAARDDARPGRPAPRPRRGSGW